MTLKQIDLDTVQPNGKRGAPARTAFSTLNENSQEAEQRLVALAEGISDALSAIAGEVQARLDAISAEALARQAIGARVVGRNRLINGAFDIWQRGTSFSQGPGGQQYTADRWITAALGCTHACSRAGGTASAGSQPGIGSWYRAIVSGTSATSAAWMGQKIEDVQTFEGQAIAVSFWAYGPIGGKIGVRAIQDFGTGGSPSASVSTDIGVLAVEPSGWTKFTGTITLPTVAGKTLGSNNNHSLYLVIDFCGTGYGGVIAGQSGTFGITNVQVEAGSTASEFDRLLIPETLMMCQRYYEKSYEPADAPGTIVQNGRLQGTAVSNAGYWRAATSYAVVKRALPAVTFYNPTTGMAGSVRNADAGTNVTGVVSAVPSTHHVVIAVPSQSTGNELNWHFVADSEL